jgi:dihydroflavonol-4-reductase
MGVRSDDRAERRDERDGQLGTRALTAGERRVTGWRSGIDGASAPAPERGHRSSSTSGCDDDPVLLITGATGYLGSVLVHTATRAGHDVRALVRDPRKAAALLPAGIDVAIGDLTDAGSLGHAARGCDAVLHVAGSVGSSPEETWHANLDGTAAVLAAARAAGVTRFVYTSSSAAVMDADGLVAEQPDGPPALTDAYSLSKAAAEELVLAAASDGMGAVIVNPVSVYGPSPAGPLSYNGLFLAAANGGIDTVVDARVGWVLAQDAAAGHLLALERGEPGRRYVLCGEVAPFGRMLHTFAGLVGGQRVRVLPPGSSLGPEAGTFARRSEIYGRFPPVRVDDAGARALGFTPSGVEEGLARTAAWLTRP